MQDLNSIVRLVSTLQQENTELHQRIQRKNQSELSLMFKKIPQDVLSDFYKGLSTGVSHLDGVGIIQALDGVEVAQQFESKQQCATCDIFRHKIRDLQTAHNKLKKNQDSFISNFQRIVQKYNHQIAKQMRTLFKYGQYQNALAGSCSIFIPTASIDIYNELIQQIQVKLNQLEFYESLNSLSTLTSEQLNTYYAFGESILKNINIEIKNRMNSTEFESFIQVTLPRTYSPIKETLSQSFQFLDLSWILQNYGKLYENETEVSEREMENLIEQRYLSKIPPIQIRISLENLELNNLFFDGIEIQISGIPYTQRLEDSIERKSFQPRPAKQSTSKSKRPQRNKVESANEMFLPMLSISNSEIEIPYSNNQTPYMGSNNNYNMPLKRNDSQSKRRSRNQRLKSNSNSINGD